MFFESFVYCLVCAFLVLFSFNLYRKTEKAYILALLSFQIIATVVLIMSKLSGVSDLNLGINLFVFFFGFVFPTFLFLADYAKLNITEYIDLKLGDYFMGKEKYLNAINSYQKALLQNSTNPVTFTKLGKAYNALGDVRTAFDRFARAVELNRNDYKSYYEIGLIFNEMNKKKDAQVVLDNALRIKPDFTEASKLLAKVLCAQNKFDEAINVYKEAIKYKPDSEELFYELGVIHTEVRDFNDALDCYKSVIRLNPEQYEAYFSIGQIYLLKGEFDSAIDAFKNASMDKEVSGRAYYQIAKVCILKEDEITATQYIQKAIDEDPTFRYKAEKEPLFSSIREYLAGLQMISHAQVKLEQEVDTKVKERYNSELKNIKPEDAIQFNYMDRFNG